MKSQVKTYAVVCVVSLFAIGMFTACQPAANTNVNMNISSANANLTPANINANTAVNPSVIAAREPDAYRATLVLSAETEGGEKTIGIPQLSAEVARNGANRRVSFKLPDNSEFIYLEKDGVHIAISPSRKQYA